MKPRFVTCAICGFKFSHITAQHVRGHGITLAEYKKKYMVTKPAELAQALTQFSPAEIVEQSLYALTPDELMDAVTTTALTAVSRRARERIIQCSLVLQNQRMADHEQAALISAKVRQRFIAEDWRLFQDEEGNAITNKDLLEVWYAAMKEQRDISDTQARLMNAVIQDNRIVASRPGTQDHEAFRGDHDRVNQLPKLDSQEREKVLLLYDRMMKVLSAKADRKQLVEEQADDEEAQQEYEEECVMEGEFVEAEDG